MTDDSLFTTDDIPTLHRWLSECEADNRKLNSMQNEVVAELAGARAEIERLRGELDAAALEVSRLERLVWTPIAAYPEIERLRGLLREGIEYPGGEPPLWRKRVREALGE